MTTAEDPHVAAYAAGIVATVREPLLVLDGELRVQFANQPFYRHFGTAPESTLGQRLPELGNGQWNIPALRCLLEESLHEGGAFEDFEVTHDFPGLGLKTMLLNGRRLRQAGSARILLAIEDVTTQRRLEVERQALEVRFTSLVKNIRDHSIFTLDTAGRVTSWNVAAERILGYGEAEVLGRHFGFIFSPGDQAAGVPEAELCTARAHGRAEDERWHVRQGGQRFWALGIVSAMHDASGRLTGFAKILRDMTPWKLADEARQSSEERLRQMLDIETVGVLVFDAAGTLVDANEPFLRMSGHSREEVAAGSLTWWLMTPPEHMAESERQMRQLAETGRIGPYEKEYLRGDGSRLWMLFAGARLADGSLVEYCIDVDDRRRAEEALEQLNQTLEVRIAERTRELRALASQLAETERRERTRLAQVLHDHLQQLLVAARMRVARLGRDAGPGQHMPAVAEVTAILHQALEASRSLAVELSPPILAEAGLIGALEWLGARMQSQHGIDVHLRADAAAEPVGEDLRFLLFECARELLLNVVKHAGVRAVDVALARHADHEIRILVTDAGAGFDPGVLARRPPDASSFGLFSIQQRLAHLGGHMIIESAPGQGTTILLVVPAPRAGPGAVGPADPAPAEETLCARRPPDRCRLLIVDDHQMIREGLVRLCEFESDIEVVGQAGDATEAIAAVDTLRPDVVLMDVNLGAVDGIEVTRRICARQPATKVIGLSMYPDAAVAAAMCRAGAVGYLTKGGSPEDLLNAIRECRR